MEKSTREQFADAFNDFMSGNTTKEADFNSQDQPVETPTNYPVVQDGGEAAFVPRVEKSAREAFADFMNSW